MRTKTMFALVIVAIMALCLTVSQPAIASDEEDVLQVATNFAKAFSTSDYELMSSLFSHSQKTTEFTPFAEGAFLAQGWEGIGAGYKSVFVVPAGTYLIVPHNPQVTMLGKDAAVVTQYLIGTYTDPATKQQDVAQFRQTLAIQKIDGKWLIVHNNIALFPTE